MVPGVLALLLIVMTIVLASMGIVRERELGTLEQLHVTPLRRWELIVGKLLPYGLIGAIDVFIVTAVATLWFEVPLRGSFGLLFALSMLFLLSTLGLGLFVSTISRHPAAGDDDRRLLLPHADDLPVGVRVPRREHAGGHPAGLRTSSR